MISASGAAIGSRTRIGAVVDAAERDDRRAGALGAEARERLRVPPLEERRDREQLGGGDDALAATAVDPHLEHERAWRPVAPCASVVAAVDDP